MSKADKSKALKQKCRCPYCDVEIIELSPICKACKVKIVYCPECKTPIPQNKKLCPKCKTRVV